LVEIDTLRRRDTVVHPSPDYSATSDGRLSRPTIEIGIRRGEESAVGRKDRWSGVGIAVRVRVGITIRVAIGIGVRVRVRVRIRIGVGIAVTIGVGIGVGVRITVRPGVIVGRWRAVAAGAAGEEEEEGQESPHREAHDSGRAV